MGKRDDTEDAVASGDPSPEAAVDAGADLTPDTTGATTLSLSRVLSVYSDEGSANCAGESKRRSSENVEQSVRQASVAMILRQRNQLELLLIERAVRKGDLWSGQVAMPGGHREAGDEDLIETAMRETREEVGLGLQRDHWLAGLGPMEGARRLKKLVISAEVFTVPAVLEVGVVQTTEVAGCMWVPVEHLLDRQHAVHYRFGTFPTPFPAVMLPDGRNVLWGLTYRFVERFCKRLQRDLASPTELSPSIEVTPEI